MVCSHCGSIGHNKRTCMLAPKSPEVPRSEKRAAKALSALLPPPNKSKKVSKPLDGLAGCQNIWKEPKDFYTKQKCRGNTCSHCGGKGHNSRTCLLSPPTVITSSTSGKKQKKCAICAICGEFGHNSRTCILKLTEKKQKKCGICDEFGHNSRTCILKLTEKKQKKCGICDEFGHNSRTCDMKCRQCSDQVARSYCFAGMTAAQAVKMTKILECGSIYGETEEYPQFVESPPAQRKTECITIGNGETIILDLGTA